MKESGTSAWSTGRRLAVITGAWCYFAALLTINNYVYPAMMGQPVSWHDAARFPVITYLIWAVFTPLILFCCERIRRLRLKPMLWILTHSSLAIVALLLIAAIWVPLTDRSGDFAKIPPLSWHFLSLLFWQSLAWNLWMYWVIVGIFYGLDYYFGARDARIRAAQLESQLAKAELDVLKSQMQPHFLFNALNLISSLIHTDVASADDMIGDLGALLRLSFESGAKQEVTLSDEMHAVELYLNIQRLRFQDTLTINIRMDPGTLEARVPHLILQPLIENAFRHGISKRVGAGLLLIESKNGDGMLKLRVCDNGPGSQGEVESTGIGLNNARARLRRLYGEAAALTVDSSPSGFSVELRFPLIMNGSALDNGLST